MKGRRKHIEELARELNAAVKFKRSKRFRRDSQGSALAPGEDRFPGIRPRRPTVVIEDWTPRSQSAYFVALHELGHVANGDAAEPTYSQYNRDTLGSEARAWLWALDHANERPNKWTREHIAYAWQSYVKHAMWYSGDPHGPHAFQLLQRISRQKEDT